MSRVVHFEIQADDPERAATFYVRALGWKVSRWGGDVPYWLTETGPAKAMGINGAIMERNHPAAGVINTVGVGSLEQTLADIEAAGGKLVHGPNEIPGIGRHAYCTDTEGNVFGVLEPSMPARRAPEAPRRRTRPGKRAAKKRAPAKKKATRRRR